MPAGRWEFTPRTHADSGRVEVVSKWTTCIVACTPASVRPAATVRTGTVAIAASASSRTSCAARRSGCDYQPDSDSPQYSRPSAMRIVVVPRDCGPRKYSGRRKSRRPLLADSALRRRAAPAGLSRRPPHGPCPSCHCVVGLVRHRPATGPSGLGCARRAQPSFAISDWASARCWSSPSCRTSCRISRAPSTSPISW